MARLCPYGVGSSMCRCRYFAQRDLWAFVAALFTLWDTKVSDCRSDWLIEANMNVLNLCIACFISNLQKTKKLLRCGLIRANRIESSLSSPVRQKDIDGGKLKTLGNVELSD